MPGARGTGGSGPGNVANCPLGPEGTRGFPGSRRELFVHPSPIGRSLQTEPCLVSEGNPLTACGLHGGPPRLGDMGADGTQPYAAAPLVSGTAVIAGRWACDRETPTAFWIPGQETPPCLDLRSGVPARTLESRREATGGGVSGEQGAQRRERKLALGTGGHNRREPAALWRLSYNSPPAPCWLQLLGLSLSVSY